ncbi:MAG: hypothetical protein QE271_05255 [Bacteriovoracaceae bacterium]|nr:hypothetical protein [Bacteriovoracaceae bacterium]
MSMVKKLFLASLLGFFSLSIFSAIAQNNSKPIEYRIYATNYYTQSKFGVLRYQLLSQCYLHRFLGTYSDLRTAKREFQILRADIGDENTKYEFYFKQDPSKEKKEANDQKCISYGFVDGGMYPASMLILKEVKEGNNEKVIDITTGFDYGVDFGATIFKY